MGLVKQQTTQDARGSALTQESYTNGVDVPAISPLSEHQKAYTDLIPKSMNKDKRILVQGILQAVIQSQGLLLEPNDGYIKHVKAVTLDLVKFVEENSK